METKHHSGGHACNEKQSLLTEMNGDNGEGKVHGYQREDHYKKTKALLWFYPWSSFLSVHF